MFSDAVKHVSKHEIDEHWSIVDLLECHELIDAFEELERRRAQKLRSKANRR